MRHQGLSPLLTALQFARSTEGNLTALVGAKTPAHLSEDLQVCSLAPWDSRTARELLS